ncbi:S-adenosylmethionine decarboxylase family protein [Hymenobacter psychrotolerans]|uniref:S-adenosylmethionine decarboxylase n=1 Tax=Hymenobacter psychrotolerans DSM 18569 TaxID=1121959 RepID=A0A1M7GJQ8_9BACT|nr:S-adenosylmethionine decarboxylase [Hymenobacter psychrotolerans]SHM16368.1 S-adenosylmethionine decarboxylase [Hymenobacter psychrotolerans DSM 18569]
MSAYSPGLHVLATFAAPAGPLTNAAACRRFFDEQIAQLGLAKVGEVYHTFPNGSFTAVIGLTESHLSIHTWPEHGQATFDVFLSNYSRDNADRARALYAATLAFFGGAEISKTEVRR